LNVESGTTEKDSWRRESRFTRFQMSADSVRATLPPAAEAVDYWCECVACLHVTRR
jgi:hypothetical protein